MFFLAKPGRISLKLLKKSDDKFSGIMTYNGLESCILNNQSYENESRTSRGEGCVTDSLDDGESSCSSSKDAFGSFSSKWLPGKRDDQGSDDWELSESPQHFYVKEKRSYAIRYSDVEAMKEKFAKLLLGEDVSGGRMGLTTALALSNAITNLAASVFGELWKLEPLAEERKSKWQREMEWLLSPTNYMVELVPAKQNAGNGRTLEIMTPKARADIHMNLPALQKLDSMLLETLDSMVNTEFWYAEVGSRAEGRNKSTRESKRWWLPLPQVPANGISDVERKKLLSQAKVVYQVFKAAKSINENVLLEMPVPSIIRDALPKSGKASLGEELYKVLSEESSSIEEMLNLLNLISEHSVLDVINKLEAAVFAWKERITEQVTGKSPVRTSWSFIKDPLSELDKTESLLQRAEALIQHLKTKNPNLPQTFLEATKIQYGKDVGHSILEAYSRVLGNLAFSILSRIGDILQEDAVSNPNSPVAKYHLPGSKTNANLEMPWLSLRVRHSLIDQMNLVDGKFNIFDASSYNVSEISCNETKTSSVSASPSLSLKQHRFFFYLLLQFQLYFTIISKRMGVPRFRPAKAGDGESSPNLFVANCGPAVGLSYEAIESVFSSFGTVKGVYAADESGARVIVSYFDESCAQSALKSLNGCPCPDLGGRSLYIRYSVLQPPTPRGQVNNSVPVSLSTLELNIPGIYLWHDFISGKQEEELLAAVDSRPWKNLAKRRVQHYGYEFCYDVGNNVLLDEL
ncbi:hypothetical protein Pint_02634 [Pistacia integerrima]|uniref:Uncharacterized protein n=1 Tax=Pistacia integerrima TaxID=434235 RepID=A0ACC0ZQV8_9ROSI|nr:hypothetical protein Pint_02634 [Pistacia integerrima]